MVADVYGRDPAGGNAIAIARALGWLAAHQVRIVTISLVGPDNPLLSGAIAAARRKGLIVVAAVGNDGPAAPPAFPASYDGVVAVTGVDGRDRALIEAGRALHLDYAAPGADMVAANINGKAARVRGTSFAAPFVAGRLHQHLQQGNLPAALQALSGEARDLGRKGPDNNGCATMDQVIEKLRGGGVLGDGDEEKIRRALRTNYEPSSDTKLLPAMTLI